MALSFQLIKPLLQTGTNAASRWFSYIGLGIGVLLLLCSLQMFMNIQDLMGRGSIKKYGFDFISLSKLVTNDNMGQSEKTQFAPPEIEELKSQSLVNDIAPLEANQFHVVLSGGSLLPFKTDIFLESLKNEFIDSVPPSFRWAEGDIELPIIVSTVFLKVIMFLPQLWICRKCHRKQPEAFRLPLNAREMEEKLFSGPGLFRSAIE